MLKMLYMTKSSVKKRFKQDIYILKIQGNMETQIEKYCKYGDSN